MNYFVKRSKTDMIDPEEILLDKPSSEKLDGSKLELPINERVFLFLFAFIGVVFFVFLARASQLQVFDHASYADMAEGNKTRSYPILANRGVIYDRNLNQMVFNVPSFDLVAVPANMPRSQAEREEELKKIAKAFKLDESEVLKNFEHVSYNTLSPVLIKSNIKREDALFIETKVDEFSGIELKKNSIREYVDGSYFSNIFGYTGKVSESDLKNNKDLSSLDYIGKSGIELIYDNMLRGVNGRVVQSVDSVLTLKKEKKVKDEIAGDNIVLTIDSDLQKTIYDDLKKEISGIKGAQGGAAVALNPKTGEILALVTYPSYDNNIFSKGIQDEYQKLLNNKLNPLFNRPIAGTYSPGSAIKPFMASAGLQEGVITERTRINDIGYISIQNEYNPDIVYTYRDWKSGGHGIIGVKDALAVSSNVFFYTVGGGYGNIEGLGIRRIKEYLNKFGFGSLTGIDLPGENAGLIPSPEWKEYAKGESWYDGDTYNSAIGQGNVLVTPLQLAMATASIANNGTLYEPHIVKEIDDKDGNAVINIRPREVNQDFIDQKNLETVREGMRMAVTGGSAIRLKYFPVNIAGKTGTAQIGGGDDTHAWFTSYAPYEDPEIVLTILIERGGEGSAAAVPVAKEVYTKYFNIEPEQPKESEPAN